MALRGLFSVVLRNVTRPSVNSTTSYHFFRHGEPSVLCLGSDGNQGLHLSSLDSSKIPDPPKHPLGAFVAYSMKRRQDLLKVSPDFKMKDMLKQIAADWGALPYEEKRPYLKRFEVENEEFKVMKEKWWNSLTEEQKEEYNNSKRADREIKKKRALRKTLHLLGKPKRPGNSYAIFVAQIDNNSIKKGQTRFDYASETWKSMTDVEKQQFKNLSNEEYARYKIELMKWENKMAADKNSDAVGSTVKTKKKSPII